MKGISLLSLIGGIGLLVYGIIQNSSFEYELDNIYNIINSGIPFIIFGILSIIIGIICFLFSLENEDE